MHESYNNLCHQSQPSDLLLLLIVVHGRATQAKPNSVLANGTANLVLVCPPNLNFHRILDEMVHADPVRQVCIDSHLCWMDAPADNHGLAVLHWLWYRNLGGPFCQLALARRRVICACSACPLIDLLWKGNHNKNVNLLLHVFEMNFCRIYWTRYNRRTRPNTGFHVALNTNAHHTCIYFFCYNYLRFSFNVFNERIAYSIYLAI